MEKNNELSLLLKFFLLTLLSLFLTNSVSHSREVVLNPTGRDIELVSLVRISDTVLGEASITITADDSIVLPKESTLDLLSSSVSQQAIQRLRDVNNLETLTQVDFEKVGLGLQFDLSTLECIIAVPNELSLTQQISLSDNNDHYNYIEPSFYSGYLNIFLNANETQSFDEQSSRTSLYSSRLDSGLNIGSLNIEYESIFENGSEKESTYNREGTRINVDFPTQGTRLVVGDMYNPGTSFQDGTDVLGLGITRDFTLIPTRNVRPKANQSFTLQRTSSVDVVIDGIVVQRLTLGAGSYNLSDIPLAQGTNDVELVITDSSGQQERIQFSIATGNDLLDSGEFEYSLMYGAPSFFDNGAIDYLSDQRLAHGYLDFGVTPWLTLGVNAQTREKLYQYGFSALFANSLGITELSGSQSHHPEFGNGHAYKVAFDAEFSDTNSWQPQLSLVYEYQSENFSGISDLDSTQSPLNLTTHYASAFAAVYIYDSLRAAVTFNYRSGLDKNNDYWSVSPSLSGPFFWHTCYLECSRKLSE